MGAIFDLLVVNPAVELLRFLFGVTGNYGWALVAFAVLVRLATWPLQLQQMRTQKAMARLAPQLEELKKKYKDDREKLTHAQMELYRENNVNMFGGCLPLLIQMPILIGLYQAILRLSESPEFASSFLWIPNLALPEGVPPIPPFTTFFPDVPAGLPILLILMVVTQFVQQQMMTPPSSDPQQQQMASMMKWMPLMFAFFFISISSGLVLYWFVQNLVGIVLQYLFIGPSGLPLPELPWTKGDGIVAAPVTSRPATQPSLPTSTTSSTPAEPVVDGAKRRANVRTKKKRRS